MALERVVVHFGQSVGGAHHDLVQLGVPQAADYALWSEGGGERITCKTQLVVAPRHPASSPSGRASSGLQLSCHGTAEPQEGERERKGAQSLGLGRKPTAQSERVYALFTVFFPCVLPKRSWFE